MTETVRKNGNLAPYGQTIYTLCSGYISHRKDMYNTAALISSIWKKKQMKQPRMYGEESWKLSKIGNSKLFQ